MLGEELSELLGPAEPRRALRDEPDVSIGRGRREAGLPAVRAADCGGCRGATVRVSRLSSAGDTRSLPVAGRPFTRALDVEVLSYKYLNKLSVSMLEI